MYIILSQGSCFYYGIDFESPLKVFSLSDFRGDGYVFGTLDIYWESDNYTTQGSLENLLIDNNSTLNFEFWRTWDGRYLVPIFIRTIK